MAVPYGLGKILDTIYKEGKELTEAKKKLKQFCFVLVGVFLVGGVANFGRVYLFNRACEFLYNLSKRPSIIQVSVPFSPSHRQVHSGEVVWEDVEPGGSLV